ncbi:hypothetical protein DL240_14945 [Lujinxingia litoralis]|uniref:Protein kinase domain-containing protein n=1 Tax=Lujinxingia litoralis TaxID=2211119 RepID=A0A328C2T8_9DELT|nr:serine/threonine-protein kinase [Lujinxingia litoralis]RAL20965.1 hypothetical protein DL240_14945 [Lujinxingia litoralis]
MYSDDPQHSTSPQIVDGRYRLDVLLSEGGVGTIWRAQDLVARRPVALKLLKPEVATLPHLRRRFSREARAASRLMHPNVAAVHDHGVDPDGRMFIAMELLEGLVVTDLIRQGLSLALILELTDQLLAGLAHAHARGVIHRDLKPSNLMVVGASIPERLGTLKLVDFGIATVLTDADPRETAHGEVVGTPRYMSPEQAAGERALTPRTDLYNVGLILYELMCGRPPFAQERGLAVMAMHVHDPIPPMVARSGLPLPVALEAFVSRALAKSPARRWPSAGEMRVQLKALQAELAGDPLIHTFPPALAGDVSAEGQLPVTLEESIVGRRRSGALRDPLPPPVPSSPSPEFPTAEQADLQALNAGVAGIKQLPFVGRPRERQHLQEIAGAVRETQRGQIILMEGEAGVGKTRLTMWLKEQAEERGILHGHIGAFTRGGTEGLRGLQEVLDSVFGTRGQPRAEVQTRVSAWLARWGHDDGIDARILADFMRPAGPHSAVRETPAAVAPTTLFATILRVLERAATRRPRLIILDDVHWAGRELGDFLDFLAVELRHRAIPLMVICTIRSEDMSENPALERRFHALNRYVGESVERMKLGRLAPDSGYELIRLMLPVDERLTRVIFERSGGNPLHLVLLLRYLRDEGLIRRDGERWATADVDAVREAVPPSLGGLFEVRLQQIEARYHRQGQLGELLRRAAIAGPRFTYEVLRSMIEREGDAERLRWFDEDLDHLLSEGVLIESHGRREDWYAFSHGLLRDYFLRQIGGAFRARRLHRMAALAREEVYAERVDAYAAEIAAHWHAARELERALGWYMRAGRTASGAAMLRQAAGAYSQALLIMDELLGLDTASEPPGLARLDARARELGLSGADYVDTLMRLGDLYEGFGEFPDAEGCYRRVVRLVGPSDAPDARALTALAGSWLGLGHIAWQRGDFEAAHWAFRRVRDEVATRAELAPMRDHASRGLARVAWHRGSYPEAVALAREALLGAQARGDDAGVARSLWILGEVARIQGDGEQARELYGRSMAMSQRAEQPVEIARNLLSLAQLARFQKTFDEAEELYQRALRRYEALGDRRGAGQCYNGLGDVARFRDSYDAARRFYDRALATYQSIGAELDVALVYTNLGLTSIALNDYAAACDYLLAARERVAHEEYPYLQAGVEYNLALVRALRGEDEDGESMGRVLELSARFPVPDLDYAQPLERLARLRAEAGHAAEARALWQRARDIYRELELEGDRARVEALIDERASTS